MVFGGVIESTDAMRQRRLGKIKNFDQTESLVVVDATLNSVRIGPNEEREIQLIEENGGAAQGVQENDGFKQIAPVGLFDPTLLDFTICTATCGSGARTVTTRT